MPKPAAHQQTRANLSAASHRQRSRKLFFVGAAGTALLLAYYAIKSDVEDPLHLDQGLLMVFLALLPALLWARRGGEQLPAFEVLMLTTANTYALPLLNGHSQLRIYSTDVITQCAFIVLLFQILAIATHEVVRGQPGRSPFFTEKVLTDTSLQYLGYGLVLSTIYTFTSIYYDELIPYEINSVARAVFFGIGMLTTFTQTRRWGQNHLKPGERNALVALLAIQLILQFSTLFLVGGISIIVLALVGYVTGARRLPILPAIALFAVVALLHNGKSAMRAKYWGDYGFREQPKIAALPSFMLEWIDDGLSVHDDNGDQDMTKKLFERTSLFHMLCLVVSNTPSHQPYLEGKTYAQIPAQFVPRFFWPDKPLGHISNSTLAIYYGLQTEEDTFKTTIGFGMVPEAYANFGFFGVGLLAMALGAAYKKIQVATSRSPFLSNAGFFLIVLLAWSFQTEHTLSIWLSSMFQACIAVIVMPFALKRMFT